MKKIYIQFAFKVSSYKNSATRGTVIIHALSLKWSSFINYCTDVVSDIVSVINYV